MKHEKEIIRFAKSKEHTRVWVFGADYGKWELTANPRWVEERTYIVDDIHAELRKLQIDKPDTKFEVYSNLTHKWVSDSSPSWHVSNEYKVKDPEMETYYEVMDGFNRLCAFTEEELSCAYNITFTKTGRTFELEKV